MHIDVFYRLYGTLGADLWEAAAHNDPAMVCELLTQHPGLVDEYDERFGRTAVLFACTRNAADSLAALAKHGADLARRGERGEPPCFVAAVSGAVECLSLLIDAGVSLDDEYRQTSAMEWLLAPARRGTRETHFDSRLQGTQRDTARMLVLAGARVESRAVPHQSSRCELREWARGRLADDAGFWTWIVGTNRGVSVTGGPVGLAALNTEGVTRAVASYLPPRCNQREVANLARAVRSWSDEEAEEARFERDCFEGMLLEST